MDLFGSAEKDMPLAWRLKPTGLDELVGQEHLLGPGRPLRNLIEKDRIVSLILFGPPGTGKTAIAQIIARRTDSFFISLNAVTSGLKEIRDSVSASKKGRTILFVDEIHRFNKIQQDALLPHVESGDITLIGASTHNPFFSLVPALASRSIIFQLNPLKPREIRAIVLRAMDDPRGIPDKDVTMDDEALDFLVSLSDGDARRALNMLELSYLTLIGSGESKHLTLAHVQDAVQTKTLYYDEDDHYDTISAFIKSMRGTDPDAAIYWLTKMIESGEDPLFLARRIVICASEDVGNADPDALLIAVAALHAVEKIGMPECAIPLAQATLYIACAPKSNSSIEALGNARSKIRSGYIERVPAHLRDSHYSGAKRLGSGSGYKYPHDYPGHYVAQSYMQNAEQFYFPTEEGFEKALKNRIEKRRKLADG